MGKNPSKNIDINHTDRQIIFRSTGETELKNEGKPVTVTGNPKDKNATVHGTVVGISIDNPA
jgi:hypothetical protein